MTDRKASLTTQDHKNMDTFLCHVLEDFKDGEITKEEAIGALRTSWQRWTLETQRKQ